jgi:Uma2 family endonuclease
MVQAVPKPLTLEEFLILPETKPAGEFINGQIIQKPMPQGKHSTLQIDLGGDINHSLKRDRTARAYSELRCTFGGRSLVPDLSIFRWDRIPRDANGEVANQFFLAPDWTIEILSPDQSQTKVVRNILHCLAHGTQLGWLIDPDEKLIFVYFPDQPIAVFETDLNPANAATASEVASFLPVPDFAQACQITPAQLFAYLNQ